MSGGPTHNNTHTPSLEDMEERQREREKQKLLNMSIDLSSYSPISSYDKPTNFTRPNQSSAFDGLCIPYGSDGWDDPWAVRTREKQEWPAPELPPLNPELMKVPSQVYPFASDAAPSLVFPYDVSAASSNVSPSSLFSTEPSSPTPSFIMSDSEEDDLIQPHKRQRAEHGTVYVKQEPEDRDVQQIHMDVTPYAQQPPLLSQAVVQHPYVDYSISRPQPQQQQYINNINTFNQVNRINPVPFTLNPQPTSLPHLAPLSMPASVTSSRRPSSMSDSDSDDDNKRKRKAPTTKKKAQPIGTHAIENTGAPVKMAKYLHVDGMATQVWIEHAIYEEGGVRTDVRMIMYAGAFNGVVVHAGDVGERIVCNRRSNISREFGQYLSPNEKILIRVPSEHRPLGQTGNVLTGYGLIRFMQSKKMRKNENQAYRRWLLHTVYSIMQARPFTFPAGHALATRTVPETSFTEQDLSR
jgi:hypothetical protein